MDNTNISTIEQTEVLVAFLAQTSQAERSSERHIKKTDTAASTTQIGDSIAAAAATVESGAPIPSALDGDAKLEAPKPSAESQSLDLSQPESTNTMAIIGWAMALVAQANSLNFSSFYKTANKSKEYAAEMAPEEGKAITAGANAQSAATQTQANQAQAEGWINLAAGLFMLGIGIPMGLSQLADEEALKSKTPDLLDTTGKAESDANNLEKAASDMEKEVNSSIKPKAGVKSTLSRIREKFSQSGLSSTGKLMQTVFNLGGSAQLITQGVGGTYKNKNMSEQAQHEKDAGVANASQKIIDQGDIQYSNQTTQQYQSNYSASNQNVDSADNNWETAVQAITQATNGLFRA